MAALSRPSTSFVVPGTSVRTQPLQNFEISTCSCFGTGILIPGTAVGIRPLKHRKVAIPRGDGAKLLVPWAINGTCPLQRLQCAFASRNKAYYVSELSRKP